MDIPTVLRLTKGQRYQIPGGVRVCIISVVPDDEPDEFLILQREGETETYPSSATAFMALKPEFVA